MEERHAHSKAKYSPYRWDMTFLSSTPWLLWSFSVRIDTFVLSYSLQVQCEYAASDLQRAAKLRSLYAVTNPPPVVAQGVLKLQMRIAKGDDHEARHRRS